MMAGTTMRMLGVQGFELVISKSDLVEASHKFCCRSQMGFDPVQNNLAK